MPCGVRDVRWPSPKLCQLGEKGVSRWFKVTFYLPVGGHWNHLKGHLTIPKRSQRIARIIYLKALETLGCQGQGRNIRRTSMPSISSFKFETSLEFSVVSCQSTVINKRFFFFPAVNHIFRVVVAIQNPPVVIWMKISACQLGWQRHQMMALYQTDFFEAIEFVF